MKAVCRFSQAAFFVASVPFSRRFRFSFQNGAFFCIALLPQNPPRIPPRDHFGTTSEPPWDHFETTSGPLWDYFETTSGPLWDHVGTTSGPLWDHFGTTSEPLQDHRGTTSGTTPDSTPSVLLQLSLPKAAGIATLPRAKRLAFDFW